MSGGADPRVRHNVRCLLPGPEAALRDSVLRLGIDPASLQTVARHGAVEVLAVEGLSGDQTRVLERCVRQGGGEVLSSAAGDRAVIFAPLLVAGNLSAQLRDWSERTAALGDAIGAALIARGSSAPALVARSHRLDVGTRTLVVGVLNVTPDSFSADGIAGDVGAALRHAERMQQDGADVIDVGGESTRPHSQPVSAEVELQRVLPVLRALRDRVQLPISIDTRKAEVAAAALDEGAAIVNDVWGLRRDPAMARTVAAHPDSAVVVMHNRSDTADTDLLAEVARTLRHSVELGVAAGIPETQIICDPGFGFAKTPAQNLELLRRLGELRSLGRPLLVGLSRKHTIGLLSGGESPPDRVEGSIAAAVLAVAHGAQLVRTHDVRATVRALRVADAVVRGTPEHLREAPAPGPTG